MLEVVFNLKVDLFDSIKVFIFLMVLFGVSRLVFCVSGVLFMMWIVVVKGVLFDKIVVFDLICVFCVLLIFRFVILVIRFFGLVCMVWFCIV